MSQHKTLDENRRYYVYVWINDDTNEPFYVGKGTKDRYRNKGSWTRNKWFVNIYKKHKTHSEIIVDNLTEEEAYLKEREIEIDFRKKGFILCNINECGYGPPTLYGKENGNYNNKWSSEKRKELSEYLIKNKLHSGTKNGRCKKCMRVEDGKIYDYMTLAAEDLKVKDVTSVSRCVKNNKYVCKGYHFVGEDKFDLLNTEEKRKEYLNNLKQSHYTGMYNENSEYQGKPLES